MAEPRIPATSARLAGRFETLKKQRRAWHIANRGVRRRTLGTKQRKKVLEKTAGRCHLCGGWIGRNERWQADHVLAHSSRGRHSIDNYLPAHRLCNKYRWDYSAEQFQWILKVGVWAVSEMRRETPVGKKMGEKYVVHEDRRESRRR